MFGRFGRGGWRFGWWGCRAEPCRWISAGGCAPSVGVRFRHGGAVSLDIGKRCAQVGGWDYTAVVVGLRRWLSVGLVGTVLVCLCGVASAQATDGAPASSDGSAEGEYYYTEFEREWYGWQTLAIDVPTLSVFFFTLREGKRVPAYTSLTLFTLGTPAVHAVHRGWKPAAISGLSRVTLSLLGGAGTQGIAKAIDGDASEDAQRAAAIMVTDLLAVAFDTFVLAYDEKETRVEYEAKETGGWWVPQVGWSGRGGWIGVAGGF